MVLLGDMGQVEPRFGPFGDTVCQVEAYFGPFGVVLVSAQDKCTVCVERTIGSEIILTHLMVTWVKWKLVSVCLEIVLIFGNHFGQPRWYS
jgi:hypothetical protein